MARTLAFRLALTGEAKTLGDPRSGCHHPLAHFGNLDLGADGAWIGDADGGDHHAGSAAHRRADRNDAEDVFVERGGVADRLCRAELADELTGLGHGAWRQLFEWCVAENLADGVIGLPDKQGLAERG